jgi:hypothetical protein
MRNRGPEVSSSSMLTIVPHRVTILNHATRLVSKMKSQDPAWRNISIATRLPRLISASKRIEKAYRRNYGGVLLFADGVSRKISSNHQPNKTR